VAYSRLLYGCAIAEFVDDEDVRVHVRLQRRLQASCAGAVGERANQFVGGGEEGLE
jgi:hypothetical protein